MAFVGILSLSFAENGCCTEYFNINNEQELTAFGFSIEYTLTRIDEIQAELRDVTNNLKNSGMETTDEYRNLVNIALKIHNESSQMTYVQKFVYFFLKHPTNDWKFLNHYLTLFHVQCPGHVAAFQSYIDNGLIRPQYTYIFQKYINIRKQFDEGYKKFIISQ
jgi:hypothetical protein